MGHVYQNPPVVEAVCEFRFAPDQPWDWTIPGLFFTEVKDDFPKKKERRALQLEMREGPAELAHSVKSAQAGMQFLREDEAALLQLGPNILSANILKPYSHWAAFEAMITRALEVYSSIASPKAFQRIGLRYINRIEVPGVEPEIEDYLAAVPRIPDSLPQTFIGWIQRTEVLFKDRNGALTLQTGNAPRQGPEEDAEPQDVAFMLDLDFRTLDASKVPLGEAAEWVGLAHSTVEEAFEACVTDKARELFGGRTS